MPDVSGDPDDSFACWWSQGRFSNQHPNLRHVEPVIRVESMRARETIARGVQSGCDMPDLLSKIMDVLIAGIIIIWCVHIWG
jgi:hypothetical protein